MTNDRLKERAYLVTLSFHAVLLLLLGWKAGLETSIALAMVFLGSVLAAPVVDGHDRDMTIMTPFNSEFQTVEPGQTAYSTAVKSLLFRQRVITCKKYRRQTSNPRFLSLPDRANNGLLHCRCT